MAASFKIASLVVAAIFILATTHTRGWAPEDCDQVSNTVTMRKPVAVPSGVGRMTGTSDLCMDCLCCVRGNPGNCNKIRCCAKRNCDQMRTCSIVQNCGCRCWSAAVN